MTEYSPEVLEYLSQFDPELLGTSEGRRILTRLEPRLFAILYLTKHVTSKRTNEVSFAPFHDEWYHDMLGWIKPSVKEAQWRRCYVAPRKAAKTTTWFLIAPMWAAAHGHAKFIVAVADNETMAQQHLATFKNELDTNELLRLDFPDLCTPGADYKVSDIKMQNGFVFKARGITGGMAGMKEGHRRPDVIICDDIEPLGGDYSLGQVQVRKNLLLQKVIPLDETARLIIAGTVAIDGSIIHQLARTAYTSEKPEDWITATQIKTRYYPCIITLEDGTEASVWSEQYSWDWIERNRKTAEFQINYMNKPMNSSGVYWDADNIKYKTLDIYPRNILSIDPAVTSKKSSDFTGIAVVAYDPATDTKYVREVKQVRQTPSDMKVTVANFFQQFPEIKVLYVEVNQGGDMWEDLFSSICEAAGVKYKSKHNTEKKEVRAMRLLNGYQTNKVFHTKEFPQYESELLAFPGGIHDDQVDAVVNAWNFFEESKTPTKKFSVSQQPYV